MPDWIATRLARVPERIAFEHGALVPIRGETHCLVRTRRAVRTRAIRIDRRQDHALAELR